MVRCGRAWLGSVRRGEVRSCYAAFNGLNQSVERCVSIIRLGEAGLGSAGLGTVGLGTVGHG